MTSKLEILTRDFCDALPNIEFFNPISLGIKIVDDDALEKCEYLQILDLGLVLPDTLFLNNKALRELGLTANQFTQIDIHLFANNPLEKLYLGGNLISDFNEMPIAPELTNLFLEGNKLSDLDVRQLLQNFRNLREFSISRNYFSCDRENEIRDQLLANRIDCYITDRCLLKQDSSTTSIQDDTTTKESDDDIKKRITDLQEQHQVSNLVIIIIAVILVLLIVGVGVGWIVRRSRAQPVVQQVAPVEEIKLEETNYIIDPEVNDTDPHNSNRIRKSSRTNPPQIPGRMNHGRVIGRVSKDDPYYEYIPEFDDDVPEYEIPNDVGTNGVGSYDHLNFNRFK